MPAKDKRYKVTADDVKRMQELSEGGMSQAAICRALRADGKDVSTGIVHYWVNAESRKKQREKNARRKYEPGTLEHKIRLERDQQKRKERRNISRFIRPHFFLRANLVRLLFALKDTCQLGKRARKRSI